MTPLIAIEGVDGVGKTTQCNLLAEALRQIGLSPRVLSLHDLTGFDRELTSVSGWATPDDEVDFFREQWCRYIDQLLLPAMESESKHDLVISDRYLLSFLAYQSVVSPTRTIHVFEELQRLAPKPLVTVILGLSRRVESSDAPMLAPKLAGLHIPDRQRRAAATFEQFADVPSYHLIGSRQPLETVRESIWQFVRPMLLGRP